MGFCIYYYYQIITKLVHKKAILYQPRNHLNMTRSIEMKYNTISMYDTYTYDMYNYDVKYNKEFFYIIIKYRNFPLHFVRGMFEN